jgi:uncharacterized glyoxalase superfamily protein PhnB
MLAGYEAELHSQAGALDGVEAFLSVAQHRSFRRAAAELGVTPSAISQAVRTLETRVGAALFIRTTRSVGLTEAGERFLSRTKPAFEEFVAASEVARGSGDRLLPAGFGALEVNRLAMPDGRIAHAALTSGGARVMLCDEFDHLSGRSPHTVDAAIARAVANGATVTMQAADMMWGDRVADIRDPFGHCWSVATHMRDVSPRRMTRRPQPSGSVAAMAGWKADPSRVLR